MIVTRIRPRRREGLTRPSISSIASGVPMMMILSPAASSVVPRGTNSAVPRLTATMSDPRGRCSLPSGAEVSGRRDAELVLEQPDLPPANTSASIAPGSRHHLLDVGGQLRLGPQHAIDAELLEVAVRAGQEVRSRHQADRLAGCAMRLAIAQATMLTSSRPVHATKNCARSIPARRSTSSLVPLPTMNSTSIG